MLVAFVAVRCLRKLAAATSFAQPWYFIFLGQIPACQWEVINHLLDSNNVLRSSCERLFFLFERGLMYCKTALDHTCLAALPLLVISGSTDPRVCQPEVP